MGKKIFIETPRSLPRPERLEEREETCREFISGSIGVRPREKSRQKRDVKAQARMNRDTTKRQRQMKKQLRKSTIDYVAGDLVYHRRRPNAPLLVVSIDSRSYDAVVEVMIGTDMIRYKAINLRKCDD